MPLLPVPFEHLVAWGQYLHWAELQLERFRTYSTESDQSARIGAVAHWLAAEYVALEGWLELGLRSERLSLLLGAYPEHKDLLRRCRNAVYHFQKEPLDPRLLRVLQDEDEELKWTTALHFELQGVLLQLQDQLRVGSIHHREVATILASAIGWFPKHPYAEDVDRISGLCAEFEDLIRDDSSQKADIERQNIATLREQLVSLDMYPMSSALKRLKRATPG